MELEAEIKGGEGGEAGEDAPGLTAAWPAMAGFVRPAEGTGRKASRGKMGGKKGKEKSVWVSMARGRDARGCGEKKSSLLSLPTPLHPPRNPALTFPTEVANLQECK